jgi:NAD(P)-dependent dehydrogenase (short-subunit alcohol dehydrogenase family)
MNHKAIDMKLFRFILLTTALCVSFNLSAAQQVESKATQKAVLVTGSNSGLGLKMTQQLSQNGFYVYAGVLHKDEMEAMNKMDNVTAVQFDVRNQTEINAAVTFVELQGRGLYGLINNAGVNVFGPLLEVPVEQLHYQMDVNVYGPVRVTQAFAPLIIESKGRIVTTGSVAGIVTPPIFGAYSMSKHAIEAFNDTLAIEMARFDVSVHIIEPSTYKSNIGVAAKKLMDDVGYWNADTAYPQELAYLLDALTKLDQQPDPAAVGEAALHAIASNTPKRRYMVTGTSAQADRVLRRQLSKMLELNDGQVHEFDRTRLVEMLDEEIAKASSAN